MKQQTQAYLLALLAVLFWSTIATAFKVTLQHANIEIILFYATLTSIVIVTAILTYRSKFLSSFTISPRQYFHSAILGFLNPFLYYLVLLEAYDLLRAQEAGTLNYIWPLVLTLLSIPILKQKISWKSVIAIFISFVGLMVISTRGRILSLDFSHPLGVILAVGSAFIWGFYWIYNVKDKRETLQKLLLNFVFGLIYLVIYVAIRDIELFPTEKGLMGSIYIGCFELGITFIIWLNALSKSDKTSKVSQLIYLSPFISLFFIHYIVKGEHIIPATIVGLILIVAGIFMQQYFERPRKNKA
ncbi:MAG: DMT family transporter [Bacteroidales bacterium]|nr:DMT family transporter [Bacteroidales bacterium]MCF8334221.1 DMT family transporter [Bacteroidales bacterium]